MTPRLTLILGGARSGKSTRAEALIADLVAKTNRSPPIYIATSQVFDDEMAERVALHKQQRGPAWETVEEPVDLPAVLQRYRDGRPVLVDCLTLWLTNVLLAEHDIDGASAALIEALSGCPGPVVCVSNEVGLGIVPDNALARRFRDAAGRLNQQVAAVADRVEFVAAGLPMVLKS
jgi:adenosylcobinamide kinase/adenosylcobinamide-phosphate guanylyltransferase